MRLNMKTKERIMLNFEISGYYWEGLNAFIKFADPKNFLREAGFGNKKQK